LQIAFKIEGNNCKKLHIYYPDGTTCRVLTGVSNEYRWGLDFSGFNEQIYFPVKGLCKDTKQRRWQHGDLKYRMSPLSAERWYSNRQLAYFRQNIAIAGTGGQQVTETWWYPNGQIMKKMEDNIKVLKYTRKGKLLTKADKMENGQKQGIWLEDGIQYYYINGVDIGREMYEMKPEEMDASKILQESNSQVRMALIKKMGADLLLSRSHAVLAHTEIDAKGNKMELYSIDLTSITTKSLLRNWGEDDEIKLLKVICPSTQAHYVLRVPPHCATCEDARQWTFGKQLTRDGKAEDQMKFKIES
jgi:hypothetical protein